MAIILAMLLAADLGYSVYSLQAAKSLRPWNQAVEYSFGAESAHLQRILLVGDSIAAGLGARSQTNTLFGRLGRHFSKSNRVILENRAVSGNKVNDLLATVYSCQTYDKVIVIIGSNDVFHFTALDAFEIQLGALAERYSNLAPQVVLVGPGRVYATSGTPVLSKPFYFQRAKKVGEIMKQVSAAYPNIAYVNPHDKLPLRDYGNTEAVDNFHPNDIGHEYWFDMVMLGFARLGAGRP